MSLAPTPPSTGSPAQSEKDRAVEAARRTVTLGRALDDDEAVIVARQLLRALGLSA